MEMMASRPPAKGFVIVGGPGIDSKAKLEKWVAHGVKFASAMPPKAAKNKAVKKPVKTKRK
jgi:hypothetical protein